MNLKINKLSEILSEAFDCGYGGGAEQRDEVIADILAKHQIRKEDDTPPPKPVEQEEEYRVYSISELRDMEAGTVFSHTTLGKCRIGQRSGEKYMAFDNPGLAPSGFNVDGYPWEIAMKKLQG